VNTATRTAAAAADWVEYCNHDGRTSQAERRRQNGRSAPWNVKWWAIGNEAYWNHRPQDYVQKYLLWRQRMRRVDPHIQCIASLVEPTWHPQPFSPLDDWLPEVIGGIREHMELASLHLYSQSGPGDGFTEQDYWRVLLAIDQRNRQRIESFLGAIDAVIGDHRVKLALDEWGLWHAGVPGDLEQPCTQRDALFAARYFHLLQRYPERVGLATIAQSVNVLHALLRTDGPRSYRTPTFHVFEMFQDHQGGSVLDMLYESPQRDVEAMTEAGPKTDIVTTHNTFDLVTASASRCADGRGVLLTWTNADLEKGYEYEIDWVGTSALTGAAGRVLAADPHAQNTFDEPERVQPRPAQATVTSGRLRLTLPPCSVAALRLSEAPAGQPG
jgi:alpha-N-arabinofuranosidase